MIAINAAAAVMVMLTWLVCPVAKSVASYHPPFVFVLPVLSLVLSLSLSPRFVFPALLLPSYPLLSAPSASSSSLPPSLRPSSSFVPLFAVCSFFFSSSVTSTANVTSATAAATTDATIH